MRRNKRIISPARSFFFSDRPFFEDVSPRALKLTLFSARYFNSRIAIRLSRSPVFPGCNKWLAPLLRREAYTTSANYSRRNERDLLGSYLSWNIKIVRVSFGYEDLERHEWISYTTRCWRCVERARFWTKITSEIERNISTIILLKLKEISERLNFVIGLSEFFTKFNLSKVSSVQRFTRNTFFTLDCKNHESLKVFEYTVCESSLTFDAPTIPFFLTLRYLYLFIVS